MQLDILLSLLMVSSSSLMLGVWGGCKSRYNQPRKRLAQPWQPPASKLLRLLPLKLDRERGWVQVLSLHTAACDSQPETFNHFEQIQDKSFLKYIWKDINIF